LSDVLAHRQQKAARQRLRRPPSKGEAQTTDKTLQPRRAPPVALRDPVVRSFCEYLHPAAANRTAEPPNQQFDANAPAMRWQIGERASIAAVNVPRHRAAGWASSHPTRQARSNKNPLGSDPDLLDIRAGWQQAIAASIMRQK